MRFLPAIPYPSALEGQGYWGEVTSTINWCEEDYYATRFSAEIVNTLTNLLFVALGAKGAINAFKFNHDTVFKVAFLGYMLVGCGSFAFHSTLKYPMQLVDELSMIYTACLMCYATFSFSQSRSVKLSLASVLIFLAVFITLYYHYLQDPLFHENAFALLAALNIFRAMYVMEVNLRPSWRKKHNMKMTKEYNSRAEEENADRRDRKIIQEMWCLVAVGLSVFLAGFAIWNLDNVCCSKFRLWRHEIGLPWGLLLEGHGWWHLFTGFGGYCYIVWAIWLRHCLNGRQEEYRLNWPNYFSIPEVVPSDSSTNRVHNGNCITSKGTTHGKANLQT